MMHAGKVSGTGERELKKHLNDHLGRGFCHSQCRVNMLAGGHGQIWYNSINFTYDGKEYKEVVEWIEKNFNNEVTLNTEAALQQII